MSIFNVFGAGGRKAPPVVAPTPAQATPQPGPVFAPPSPRPLKGPDEKISVAPAPVRHQPMFVPTSVVARLSQRIVLAPETTKAFKQAQLDYDRFEAFQMNHLPDRADQAWWNAQQEIAELVRSGKPTPEHGWSREEWRDDFHQKIRAIRGEATRLCSSLLPLRFEIAEQIGKLAGEEVQRIERVERDVALAWGLDYRPSQLVTILRYIAAHHQELVNVHGVCPPRKMLEFAGIKL